jgi:hypothetical protein
MYCTAEAYVSITEDPIGWAKSFGEATAEHKQTMYRQFVEDVARSKTGGMWATLVNLVTRDRHLTASELLSRLNENLHIIPNEYKEAVSFVTAMRALGSLTDREVVQSNFQKVETMAKVFGVPSEMAKKLYLKQLLKNSNVLTKYPNIIKVADSFITVENVNTLDMPKRYAPTQGVNFINTELVHADQKLPEAAPTLVPEISIQSKNSLESQSKQDAKSNKIQPIEEKETPKQEQPKEQISTAKPTDDRQMDRLLSELSSRNASIKELQEKITELESQPKEFRPYLIEEGHRNSKENVLDAQLQTTTDRLTQSQQGLAEAQQQNRALDAQVAQKDTALRTAQGQLRTTIAERGNLEARLQASTDQLTQKEDDIRGLTAEKDDLGTRLTQRETAVAQLTAERDDLEAQLTQSQRGLTEAQDQLTHTQTGLRDEQARSRNLDAQVAQKEAEKQAKEAENNALRGQLRTTIAERGNLEARLQASTDQLTQKEDDIRGLTTERGNLEAQLTQSQRGLTDQRAQNQTLEAEKQAKEAENNALTAQVAQKEDDIARLNREQEKVIWKLLIPLQNTVTQKDQEIKAKEADIARLTAEKGDLEAQLTQSQRELGDQRTQKQALDAQVAQKEAEKQAKEAEKQALTTQLQTTTDQLQATIAERVNLQARLTQSQQELGDQRTQNQALEDQKRALEAQNRGLQDQINGLEKQVIQLLAHSNRDSRKELLKTVDKILRDPKYLDVMSYKVPPELPAPSMRPLPNDVVGLIYARCNEIYTQGIKTLDRKHTIHCYEDLINLNESICTLISSKTRIMNELKRSLICMQNMLVVPRDKDIKTFLQKTKDSLDIRLTLEQELLQKSLELFVAKFEDYKQLVTNTDDHYNSVKNLTVEANNCFSIWPSGKCTEKLGLAMLKNFQLMKLCNVDFQTLKDQLEQCQGSKDEKNVLDALRQIKMKFYVLGVLKVAEDVASPLTGFFGGGQPSILQEQLENMARELKVLALEDAKLTDIEWFIGCQYFTDPCPAKDRIQVSLDKAESVFQKIYREGMSETGFFHTLFSKKLKDLL